MIDLTDLSNVTGNIGVFFCTVFFGDVPQCIAGRNADTGVVFVGWSFRLTVCLRILRREVEDLKKCDGNQIQESGGCADLQFSSLDFSSFSQ